jgi:mono/diheme cytochrome c family protein
MKRETVAVGHSLWLIAFFLALAIVLLSWTSAWSQSQWQCPTSVTKLDSPLVSAAEVIDRGRQLVRQSCAECHGEAGLGDGPAAANLMPAFSGS